MSSAAKKQIIEQSKAWLGLEASRYTSYPSAQHFHAEVSSASYGKFLAQIGDAPASVYVHVPFCQELCWFCGCHTKMTKQHKPVAEYVRYIIQEIALIKQQIGAKINLQSIHFGGGSPSLLEAGELEAILYAIADMAGQMPQNELAIELDPRTTNANKIANYAKLGFDRISLGIQDFDVNVQKAINRIQPYEMVAELVAEIRSSNIKNLNFDLIYGLPLQTAKSFQQTLELALQLAPDRISLFSYAHMPHLKKHQRLIATADLPNDDEKLYLYLLAQEILSSAGYKMIGIDHFAKTDDSLEKAHAAKTMRRNFQGYVDDNSEYIIAVGASAISQFPQGYFQNEVASKAYSKQIANKNLATIRGYEFSGNDKAIKKIIDNLMCFMGVDLAQICSEFNLPESYFLQQKLALQMPHFSQVVVVFGNKIYIKTPLKMAARAVAAVFDEYKILPAAQYSKVL
jgi:oxygen-independent coproporphyrinogen-3 oxidase